MKLDPSYQAYIRALRELLMPFLNCELSAEECRRAVLIMDSDIRPVVHHQLFRDAVQAGLLKEVEGGRFRLTESGAAIVASADLQSIQGIPNPVADNANQSLILHK